MAEAAAGPDGWEATLAAALVGADRAPPLPAGGPFADLASGGDPGAALLARLAAQGVHHVAGTGRAADALAPASPLAQGTACPSAAAARLALLLAGGGPALGRVREWCRLAAGAGMRAPPWLLPALAAHRRDWPGEIDPVAGLELDWLDRVCADADPPEAAAPQDWTEGTPPERRAAFAAFRRSDPGAARAALEASLRAEKADLRHQLVSGLEVGLSEADAPFLETCLDDRAAGVRAAAQGLLRRLPGSLLATRMAERARAALTVTGTRRLLGGMRHDLAVTLPEASPDLARDGIEPSAYARGTDGVRATLLRDVLAGAPPHAFGAHPPRLWIELGLKSAWPRPILDGLFFAARRARDPDWVRAFVAVLGEAEGGRLGKLEAGLPLRETWVRAAALLPAAEWDELACGALRAGPFETALDLLGDGPGALSAPCTAALLDRLAAATRQTATRQALARSGRLPRLAERAHPDAAAAAAAAAILARLPDAPDEPSHTALRNQLAGFAETLDLRATLRREFLPA